MCTCSVFRGHPFRRAAVVPLGTRASAASIASGDFARLAEHGIVLDVEAILAPSLTDATRSVGRPWIARALIAGGYVADISEAFDRWLSPGKPGFVPRRGEPEEVFERIHEAGGLAALARQCR